MTNSVRLVNFLLMILSSIINVKDGRGGQVVLATHSLQFSLETSSTDPGWNPTADANLLWLLLWYGNAVACWNMSNLLLFNSTANTVSQLKLLPYYSQWVKNARCRHLLKKVGSAPQWEVQQDSRWG